MAPPRRRTLRGRRRAPPIGSPEPLEPRLALSSAPVVAGPAAASALRGGTLAFTAPSPGGFTVADADPTAAASVALAASAGSLSVNLSAVPSGGATFYVDTAAQFNARVDKFGASFATLHAGDRVLLKGGSWSGIVATITGSMTDAEAVSNPALILACDAGYVPTRGGVVVNGVSAIDLAGTGISFVGVTFSATSGMLKKGNSTDYDDTGALAYLIRLDGGSRYMTVSQVTFDHCGWSSTDYANNDHYGSWIAVYGFHHTIRGCDMTGRDFDPTDISQADATKRRSIREATIIVYKDAADVDYGWHQIDYNFFGERKIPNSKDANLYTAESGRGQFDLYNGWETIRCGSSDFTTLDFNTTIEFNTFYHSIQSAYGNPDDQTGEPEMVSIKSCRNTVRFNTILNNYGEVCVRQGDYNVIADNAFLAGGAYDAAGNIVLTEQKNTRMGGVRVFGFGNTVANNYFSGLSANGIRSALVLGSGGTDPGTVSGLNNGSGTAYETATYTHVIGNTFVDCATITLDNPNGELYPVYGTQFLNNVITYSGNIGADGLVGNTNSGYGALLLAAHGGRAAGNYVYSASSSQLGSARALLGETWLNETFEAYATGSAPNGTVSPLLMSQYLNYTTIAAGNGGKMARYLKTTSTTAGALQYSLSAGNAIARAQGFFSFDIQQNANASVGASNELYFRVGDNTTSGLTNSANAFIDLRFKQDTTSNFSVYSVGTQVGSTQTISASAVNQVRIWFNNTSATMNYVDPTNVGRTLAANSFVVFVNATLATPTASGSALPGGAVTAGIGKIGFLTNSTKQADFSVDNVFAGDADTGGVVNTMTTSVSPALTARYDVLSVPAATSPLVGQAAGPPTVLDTSSTAAAHDLAGTVATYAAQDLRGLPRPATGRDIGSYEVEATGAGFRPLRRAEVGPAAAAYPTVSGAVLASGANGSGALTIAGTLGQINAVLATLTYTAPSSGSSATLTVQANDGGTANNLSTPLVTTIALTDELVFDVAVGQTVTDATARSGAIKIVKRGAGTLVLNAAGAHTGTTTVEAGTLVVAAADALAASAVTVAAGATLKVNPGVTMRSPSLALAGGTLDGTGASLVVNATTGIATFVIASGSVTGSPSLAVGGNGIVMLPTDRRQVVALTALSVDQLGGGRIDIGKGRIDIAAGGITETDLRADVVAGRNGGAFNGTSGIMTTGGTVGVATQAVLGYRVLGTGAAIVAWAAFGDSNLDGQVNLTDVSLINNGGKFGQGSSAGATWAQGDFNYSGGVTLTDISLLNNSGLYGRGSYLPVAPAGQALSTSASGTTSASSISQDVWIALALDAESQQQRKR